MVAEIVSKILTVVGGVFVLFGVIGEIATGPGGEDYWLSVLIGMMLLIFPVAYESTKNIPY